MTLQQAIILADTDAREKTGLANIKPIISDCFHALRADRGIDVAFCKVHDNYFMLKSAFTSQIITMIFSSVNNIFMNNSIEY